MSKESAEIRDQLFAMGFRAREVPILPGFSHHTIALTPENSGPPHMDITVHPIPVLAIDSGLTLSKAYHRLLESAVALRAGVQQDVTKNIGIDRNKNTAIDRALAKSCEQLTVSLLSNQTNQMNLDNVGRLRERETDSLKNIDGSITISKYDSTASNTTVVAELRLAKPPYYLAGVGCGEQSTERALSALYCKFDTFRLVKKQKYGDVPWVRAALNEGYAETDEPLSFSAKSKETTRQINKASSNRHELKVWNSDGLWYAEAMNKDYSIPPTDNVFSFVNALALSLEGPVSFSMSNEKRNVLLSRTFHENTKISTRFKSTPVFDSSLTTKPIRSALSHAVRDYRYTRLEIPLIRERIQQTDTVEELFKQRRSWAKMAQETISLSELSHILTVSYGVTGSAQIGNDRQPVPLRATPSGGGLYPCDIYILANKVDNIPSGLYYFNPNRLVLQLVNEAVTAKEFAANTGYAARVEDSAAIILLGAAFKRTQWKYWERGYRVILLDCGHLAQSLVVVANSLKLIAHPIGGFLDDYVNGLAGLNGIDDAILHVLLIGRKDDGE